MSLNGTNLACLEALFQYHLAHSFFTPSLQRTITSTQVAPITVHPFRITTVRSISTNNHFVVILSNSNRERQISYWLMSSNDCINICFLEKSINNILVQLYSLVIFVKIFRRSIFHPTVVNDSRILRSICKPTLSIKLKS